MSSTNLDEIYVIFDTNIIRHNDKYLETFDEFYLHKYDKIEKFLETNYLKTNVILLIPEIVIMELTNQKKNKLKRWICEIEDYSKNFSEFKEFLGKTKKIDINKHIDNIRDKKLINLEIIPIPPNKEQLFENILNRSLMKIPPFKKNDSDRGFKDSILFLSLMYYAKDFLNTKFVLFSNDGGFSDDDQRKKLQEEFSTTGNSLDILTDDVEGYVKEYFGIDTLLSVYVSQGLALEIEEEIKNYKKIRIEQNEFDIKSIKIDPKTYQEDESSSSTRIFFKFILEYIFGDTVLSINDLTREFLIDKNTHKVISKGDYNYDLL